MRFRDFNQADNGRYLIRDSDERLGQCDQDERLIQSNCCSLKSEREADHLSPKGVRFCDRCVTYTGCVNACRFAANGLSFTRVIYYGRCVLIVFRLGDSFSHFRFNYSAFEDDERRCQYVRY